MQGIIILHFFLLLCLCSVLNWMSRSSLYTVCILGGPNLSKCLSILVKPAILFSSLHGTGFAHFCSSFLHETCWITERYAQKSRHTARRQFDCCSWLALEWEMRAQGEVPPLGRAAMVGLRWQGWRAAGSPGSPRESGAAAGARLGGGWSGGCRQGEPASSRWLESIWVSQLRAGLPLYPQHTPASGRPADTLSVIYRHRFVEHSRCLRDSADFTLA